MSAGRPTTASDRILFVSMYPIGATRTGPTVRIAHLLAALRDRVEVDVISGTRRQRRGRWLRFVREGGLLRVAGVYVETSSALPDPADLAGLAMARRRGLSVLSYVRDAYQLFRDEYPPADTWHGFVGRAFPIAVAALRRVSTRLAFPTRGLADAVLGTDARSAVLLPPGSPPSVDVPRAVGARTLLYVGDMRLPAQGGDTLVRAVGHAREAGAELELLCVVRPGGEPPSPLPSWARLVRADADEIPALLGPVLACVVPRAPGRYNELALPIKLMEYLAYGRPVVVTDRRETAELVRSSGAGIVVGDGAQPMADGLLHLANASELQLTAWSDAARAAAVAHGWPTRASEILRVIGA